MSSRRPFDGLCVVLDVRLDGDVGNALVERIRRAGARRIVAINRVVDLIGAETSTVVICQDQSSPMYTIAVAGGCTVANMQWLLDVLATGDSIDPGADILHRVCPAPSAAVQALVRLWPRPQHR